MRDDRIRRAISGWLEKRRKGAAVLVACAVAACTQPPEPHAPDDVFSPDCLAWGNVQEDLANLGFRLLAIGGRLDTGVLSFEPPIPVEPLPGAPELGSASCSSGGQVLTVPAMPERGAEARPAPTRKVQVAPVPGISAEEQRQIDEAVARINANPEAVVALAWHYAHARQLCQNNGGCPETRYRFQYEKVEGPTPGDLVYRWVVDGEQYPTAFEWNVYASIYSGRPPLCPLLPSMSVRTRASGIVQVAGRSARERARIMKKSLRPCPCGLGTSYGRGTPPNCSDC
jgi:hypothetical protein